MTKQPGPPKPPKGTTGPTAPDSDGRIEVPLHESEAIVALLVIGRGELLKLPPKNVFRVGRGSSTEVRIPDTGARPLVSREHVELTRQGSGDGTWLQVVDLGSMHGTSFQRSPARDFAVRAGERFQIADVELMVLDKMLVRLRRILGGFFGYSNHTEIDKHLSLGIEDESILLIGPRGSERGHLASAIHFNSRRRGKAFREIPKPKADKATLTPYFNEAKHGSVFVSLDNLGPRAGIGPLKALLFDKESYVRPMLAARDSMTVTDLLSDAAPCLRKVMLPPVAAFGHDVPALIDAMLEDDFASHHRVAELEPDRADAMRAYAWKENRTEVRAAAKRLLAYLRHGRNMSAAARWIGEDYETYRAALKRVGIRRD